MDESGLPPMMTVESVAAYFRVSAETVRRWTEDGRIDTIVLPRGRRLRFRE
jgi:excisionase family DNA binding protein